MAHPSRGCTLFHPKHLQITLFSSGCPYYNAMKQFNQSFSAVYQPVDTPETPQRPEAFISPLTSPLLPSNTPLDLLHLVDNMDSLDTQSLDYAPSLVTPRRTRSALLEEASSVEIHKGLNTQSQLEPESMDPVSRALARDAARAP